MRRLSAAPLLMMLLLLITAACASDGGISEHVDFCCGPKDARLETYSLSMPTRSGVSAADVANATGRGAFSQGNACRSIGHPDALVTLVYSAYFPDTERPYANDGFTDPMSVDGPAQVRRADHARDHARIGQRASVARHDVARASRMGRRIWPRACARGDPRGVRRAAQTTADRQESRMTQPSMEQPLAGITVLDFGQIYNGPYCGFLLAMAGARVIKIESPQGESLRGRGETSSASYPFAMLNSNKEAVTLNLKSERGRELLRELVKKADVLLENFSPGTMDRHGVGSDALQAINPRLIYAAATGFGRTGPHRDYLAMDITVQAMTRRDVDHRRRRGSAAEGGSGAVRLPGRHSSVRRDRHRAVPTRAHGGGVGRRRRDAGCGVSDARVADRRAAFSRQASDAQRQPACGIEPRAVQRVSRA